jgi:hypothetical protein
MAQPIAHTPVLKGKDAKSFISKMKGTATIKITVSHRMRIASNYSKIKGITKS